jgi:RNA polymerase sigma factor (TIGR02999 family)
MIDALSLSGDITRLLGAVRRGDRSSLGRLFERVYDELRQLARGQRRPGGGETMRTTALIHETYLKMMQGAPLPAGDRNHFFSTVARAMRQILVDYARRRQAQKRGAGVGVERLDEARVGATGGVEEILAVDRGLARLEALEPRLARLVELRFYAGFSVEETAATLAVSERTVKRDWRKARAFLWLELTGGRRQSLS